MTRQFTLFSAGFFCAALLGAQVGLAQDIPEAKRTGAGLYATAAEAADMLNDPNVLFVDIRSRAEVAFLGLPARADVHIPYMDMPMMADFNAEKGTYDLEINPDFPVVFAQVAAQHGLGKDATVILMCRSGTRSAKAADLLAQLGWTHVYSVIDGYEGDTAKEGPGKGQRVVNGWKNAGLAWSYKIKPEQAYPADL